MEFSVVTDYHEIIKKLDQVDPVAYGRTRNYVDGAVTGLSPYISRGVISTRQVLDFVLAKGNHIATIEIFLKELCWRDYFQRVAQVKDVNTEIKQLQTPVSNYEMPAQVLTASTGITGIDTAIQQLYQNGYMHNHCRMYTASLVCNLAKSHWHHAAQWMYYHLLDGDWASNASSWQWVAGANSNKKYYANQENINRYTYSNQVNTFLDRSYEALENMEIPVPLRDTVKFDPEFELPPSTAIEINTGLPTFIYNYYNLDPLWHQGEPGNRILLVEPAFFSAYPVSKKCIQFMLALSKNIPGIQIFNGSFPALVAEYQIENMVYKEHPLNIGYRGTAEDRDWIVPSVSGYYPSFFSYWKQVKKHLYI